jgi:hypothetical protein
VSHFGLAIYVLKHLKAKEDYGNSNISPCKYIIFQKKPTKRKPKSFKILLL